MDHRVKLRIYLCNISAQSICLHEVRGQLTAGGSLLPSCGFQELNSDPRLGDTCFYPLSHLTGPMAIPDPNLLNVKLILTVK